MNRLLLACLLGGLAACSPSELDLEAEKFDRNTALGLTVSQKTKMDIEFFNEFWLKNDLPAVEREERIRSLINGGFETAYIAQRLFKFEEGGIPRARRSSATDFERLKELAEDGDVSAMCLYTSAVSAYRAMNFRFPDKEDVNVLTSKYRQVAIERRHPYCWWIYGRKQGGASNFDEELQCARDGSIFCQLSVALQYLSPGASKENEMTGLCWMVKARDLSNVVRLENTLRTQMGVLSKSWDRKKLEDLVNGWRRDTTCG